MIKHMDVEDLERLEDAVIVDVREAEEHRRGSVEDAVNIPLADFLDQVEMNKLDYPKNQLLVIHCMTGNRSLIATEAARKAGYRKAHNLRGGYVAYTNFMKKR